MNFKRYHVSKNLFDKTSEYVVGTTTYNYTISGLDPSKYYTCSTNFEKISGVNAASLYFNGSSSANNGVWSDTPRTFKPNSNGECIVYIRYKESSGAPSIIDDVMTGTIWVMVNEGSTPLDYEPYSSEVWHDTPHYIHKTDWHDAEVKEWDGSEWKGDDAPALLSFIRPEPTEVTETTEEEQEVEDEQSI